MRAQLHVKYVQSLVSSERENFELEITPGVMQFEAARKDNTPGMALDKVKAIIERIAGRERGTGKNPVGLFSVRPSETKNTHDVVQGRKKYADQPDTVYARILVDGSGKVVKVTVHSTLNRMFEEQRAKNFEALEDFAMAIRAALGVKEQ